MKNILLLIFPILIWSFTLAQPANDNCTNAVSLTSGAACTSGTTENATMQGGEINSGGCLGSTATESVWYSFTATSTDMFVNVDVTGFGTGSFFNSTTFGSIVYNTSSCLPGASDAISCEVDNNDYLHVHNLTGLTVGNTYLVQVVNRDQGPYVSVNFCIQVGDQPSTCGTCASACGPACGFANWPADFQAILDTCGLGYTFEPMLEENETYSYCYTFTAQNTTVDFQLGTQTVGCSSGQVTSFTWDLYNLNCGGGILQSGTLTNTQFTGLTIGNSYTFCYTFDVPSNCHHVTHYPYVVGVTPTPLDLDLVSFYGKQSKKGNQIYWTTESISNQNEIILEHSEDGGNFFELESFSNDDAQVVNKPNNENDVIYSTKVTEVGSNKTNIGEQLNFSFLDENPVLGINYYRLKQLDLDGNFEYSVVLELNVISENTELVAYPNPVKDQLNLKLITGEQFDANEQVKIYDIYGKEVMKFQASEFLNKTKKLSLEKLNSGIYIVKFQNVEHKFTKQ